MAGRSSLRLGTHGKITRINQGGGVWLARCRYRDNNGVTRVVQRLGPAVEYDQHGKLAEDALIEPSPSADTLPRPAKSALRRGPARWWSNTSSA
jgi:hypothetical protein